MKLKRLWNIFWIFFKIGAFTFGGGLAMLPLIQREVVDKRDWVTEVEILDIFAISQSVPGVIAINSAIFIGNRLLGTSGAVAATLGVVLPAFLSIIIVITILTGLRGNVIVEKVFTGIRAAAAALILLAALKLGKTAMQGKIGYLIAVIAFGMIVIFNIHAMWAVIFGGATGLAVWLINKGR
ncbi:MAG: chromate transporter [Firmicutes bacterium]|nr:chromate transporter [Bacillota bacterium]